jgi:predicted nucleic acid-binding protein
MFRRYGQERVGSDKKIISWMPIVDITHFISATSRRLIENYSLSHNLDLPDALIAAICLKLKLPLYTLNTKHFKYIPELNLYRN